MPTSFGGELITHIVTWIIGACIGVGQSILGALNGRHRHNPWRYVAQALVSGGLGAASGAILLLIPNAPTAAVLGLSAAIATLGVSFLESLSETALRKAHRWRTHDDTT